MNDLEERAQHLEMLAEMLRKRPEQLGFKLREAKRITNDESHTHEGDAEHRPSLEGRELRGAHDYESGARYADRQTRDYAEADPHGFDSRERKGGNLNYGANKDKGVRGAGAEGKARARSAAR
jgi:hypothetical protein